MIELMNRFCFLFLFAFGITSCTEYGCSTSDWIGTYDKIIDDKCNSVFYNYNLTITEGTCEDCISIGATTDLIINQNCTIDRKSTTLGNIVMSLDGNFLKISVPDVNCFVTYRKQ